MRQMIVGNLQRSRGTERKRRRQYAGLGRGTAVSRTDMVTLPDQAERRSRSRFASRRATRRQCSGRRESIELSTEENDVL
jgi:hypothetical protein